MNKFKKWLIPVAAVCLLLATLIGCSSAPASLGETFDPSGNPFANRFTDVSDYRAATFLVAASDSEHKYEADYRCDGANDQVQINAALAAVDGARVFLLEGTFSIETAIVVGDGDSLVGSGPGTVITFPNTLAADISAIEDSNPGGASHDIVLENFTLDGNSAGVAGGNQTGITIDTCGSGVGAAAVPGIIIRNLVIKDFTYEAIWLDTIFHSVITECKIVNTDGVWISTNSAYCQITENEIFKSEYYHLHVETCDHFLIADNILQYTDGDGLTLTTVSDSIITGNIVKDGAAGVDVRSSDNNAISGNLIQGGSGDGIYMHKSVNNTISGNTIQGNGGEGINFGSSNFSNTICGNTICGNDTDGIYISGGEYNTVSGNTICYSGEHGIYLSGGWHTTISGNTIYGNSQSADNTFDNIFLEYSSWNLIADNIYRITTAGTTLTADEIIGATDIRVTATLGFRVGMGVVIDLGGVNEEYHRISAITVSTVITIDAGLTNAQGAGETIDVPKARYGINISDDACAMNCLIGNDLYDSGSTGDLNDVPTTNPTLKHDNRDLAGTGWLPEV